MWLKRIGCFLLINFLVIMTISLVLHIFNVQPHITRYGMDYNSLMAFCLVWGMGGAFISLLLSKTMAKWMMGVRIIEADTRDPMLQELVKAVHTLARRSGLKKMPEVGIYSSPEVNAFATGPSRSNSLVAVSSGMLQRFNGEEIEGVLGHEVAHIANGDMVTMTLVQGIINAFVMFLARALAYAVVRGGSKERSGGSYMSYYILTFIFQIAFMILGSIVVAAFSRYREFRADAGSAKLVGAETMIQSLQGLKRVVEIRDPNTDQAAFQSFKISSSSRMMSLFSTHPNLDKRIERLKALAK
jgi:heat shock protein HtpX